MVVRGSLYIIAAASGTGKTSLAEALANSTENIKISISHTTRPRRWGEQDHQHYFFVNNSEFESLVKQGAFLEYAKVFGYYYGTSRDFVAKQLAMGVDVILDIDWQGARQVREQIEATSIFLLPPSQAALRTRIEKRKSDSTQVIETRLAKASAEINHCKEFDYIVINDKFDDALLDLKAIVRSQRLLWSNQLNRHNKLITELLN